MKVELKLITGHAIVQLDGRMASVGIDGLLEMAEGLTGRVPVLWLDTSESELLPPGRARVSPEELADAIRALAAPAHPNASTTTEAREVVKEV